MIEVGQVCVKLAGRDAGRRCVVIDRLDDNTVLIDGETRRRKCNISHLELLGQQLDVKKGESHEAVVRAFSKLGVEIAEKKPKQKLAGKRPMRQRGAAAGKEAEKETSAGKKEIAKKENKKTKKIIEKKAKAGKT